MRRYKLKKAIIYMSISFISVFKFILNLFLLYIFAIFSEIYNIFARENFLFLSLSLFAAPSFNYIPYRR